MKKKKFNEILSPHQQEKIGEWTLLDKAIIEHNLLASSKVYNNIRFEDLGNLLNITPDQAERIAATMITEDRLRGSIDQIKGLIHFKSQNSSDLLLWDGHIETLCSSVNSIIDIITDRYNQFSKKFQN